MENGNVDAVIQNPQHPYTHLLVRSIPVPDPKIRREGRTTSSASEVVHVAENTGGKFYQRCLHAMQRCAETLRQPMLWARTSLQRAISMRIRINL